MNSVKQSRNGYLEDTVVDIDMTKLLELLGAHQHTRSVDFVACSDTYVDNDGSVTEIPTGLVDVQIGSVWTKCLLDSQEHFHYLLYFK